MGGNSFFDEQTDQSLVKATIISKYFFVWAKVIINTQKKTPGYNNSPIAYIDLFAGPGRYSDGSQSTPVKIITSAISDSDIRDRLVTLFNDRDTNNSNSLEKSIFEIPGIDTLKYTPEIKNEEIGENIVKEFEKMSLVPTLFFVDPWGYKGLSLRLVNSVLKDWGCDCVFFFNYNRVSMGLSNPLVKKHMEALFGAKCVEELKPKLEKTSPRNRELIIIEELCRAIKSYGSRFVLPFRFKDSKGKRTSHHLIFVSKHVRGYEIMKEIMAKESSDDNQGVPTFEYNPADFLPKQSLLFQLSRPLDDLKGMLLEKYSSKTITMYDIYSSHHIDTPYIKSNYKEALKSLEAAGKIKAIKLNGKPRKAGTFADDVSAIFPKFKY